MGNLSGLNIAQREAVLATEGPLLVLAGAGAGKTRVIVERIRQIIRQGVAPEAVLAITFTNKAAAEMRQRIQGETLTQDSTRFRLVNTPFVSTFHSLGLAIIKEHHKELGLKRAPAVYDRADSMREIKKALKEVGGEDIEPRAALAAVSRAKGEGVGVGEFAAGARGPYERRVAQAWERYERALAHDGALDFDDLLVRAAALLSTNRAVRDAYRARWQYIHIDEYQDTNHIQAELAGLLVGRENNVCAVGDIDQTIYSWRGAQIANLLRFEERYAGARVVVLEENYRSTQNIIAAANEVIAKNTNRREKNLFTKNGRGAPLSFYMAFDETDEAGFVARIIGEETARGASPRDFAVLYRANFQSAEIEKQLLAAEIPYQVLGTKFYDRKEVKDVLAYLRAALYGTPADIARAALSPARGIGKVTLLKMLAGERAGDKAARFRELLDHIRTAAAAEEPAALVARVVRESGMERALREDKYEGRERLENVYELAKLAARHKDAEEFLAAAALASDQDALKEEHNAVRLMTVHASKGLEFDTVFVTGLEEGLFPYGPSTGSGQGDNRDKEEERRLMYVALTRAKRKVYLTMASYRTVFGSKNATVPSQFLSDIPGELLHNEVPERLGKTIYLD